MKEKQLRLFELEERNSYSLLCQKFANRDFLTPDEFGYHVRNWSRTKGIKINTLSLFSGAGGLDIGFEDVGFNIIESVEIEQKFVQTALLNQGKGKYYCNTKINCANIRDYSPNQNIKIDFIIGGPPCQSFSSAGRRVAGVRGINDDRGTLFQEYVRILKELQPRGFLFENVYGLLGAQGGDAIKQIVQAFKEVGYKLSYRVLDTADYGVPQHRERLIIVGLKDKYFKLPKPTHGPDSKDIPFFNAANALEGLTIEEKASQLGGKFGHLLKEIPPGLNYSFFTEKMGHPNPIFAWRSKFSDFLYKADPTTPIRTLKASGGQYTGPFHWCNRRFTISELKRLQTFPDDYEFVGNYAVGQKQIGNSVPPQFARILGLALLNQVFDIELPFDLKYLNDSDTLSFRKLKREKTNAYLIKAKEAIRTIDVETTSIEKHIQYSADLKDNFEWVKVDKNGEYTIKIELEEEIWRINLRNKTQSRTPKIEINIYSQRNDTLFKKVKKIELTSNSYILKDYTALWKAFEDSLSEHNIKVDLVQFAGYYQYKNEIDYNIIFHKKPTQNKSMWKIISMLYEDTPIGKIEPIDFFTQYFHIEKNELLLFFRELKNIGFEIRNTKTNPEIKEDYYLIPYRFPTLNPLSIQLNKSL